MDRCKRRSAPAAAPAEVAPTGPLPVSPRIPRCHPSSTSAWGRARARAWARAQLTASYWPAPIIAASPLTMPAAMPNSAARNGPGAVDPRSIPTRPTAPHLAAADRMAFRALMQYADQLDALPLELTRTMSDLRELDAVLGAHVNSLTTRMSQLTSLVENREATPGERLVTLKEVAEEARAYKLGGDDKIRVAVAAADTLEAAEAKLDEAYSRIASHPTIAPFAEPVPYLRHLGLIPGSVPDLDALARTPGLPPPPPSGVVAAAAETLSVVAQRTGLSAPSSTSHHTASAPSAPSTSGTTAAPEPTTGTPKRRGGKTTGAQVPPSRSNTPQLEAVKRTGTGSRASPTTTAPAAGGKKRKAPGGAEDSTTKKRRNKTAAQADANESLDDPRMKGGKNDAATPSPHPANAAAPVGRRNERLGTPAESRSPALGGRRAGAQGRGGSAAPATSSYPLEGVGGKGPPPGAITLTAQAGPDEPRYCFCNQVSFGEMIGCDAPDCPREWFHLSCVGLTQTPEGEGTWFCAECQARRQAGAATGTKKKKPQTRKR